ncbi:MAG: phosphatase PAP2 family protein [Alphaproteobacteria bacterium]
MRIFFFLSIFLAILVALFLRPQTDLAVSGWFYQTGSGFSLGQHELCLAMQWLAFYGARILGFILLALICYTYAKRKKVFAIDGKGWLFLFLALVIGPGLIANGILKDHWGRARPREVTEFGGSKIFSGPLLLQDDARRNGSFVSGDASFGFFLPSFAYVASRKRHLSRRFFWGGMGFGALFGLCRIIMGAHFLSDVLFAAAFMLLTSAILYALMYSRKEVTTAWRHWFFEKP